MTFTFTEREYTVKLLEVIVDRGDGYKGSDGNPEPGTGCSYVPGVKGEAMTNGIIRVSADRCVHGETLHRFGVSDEVLANIEGRPIDGVLDQKMPGVVGLDWLEAMWDTQSRQDAGEAYGELKPPLESLLETL